VPPILFDPAQFSGCCRGLLPGSWASARPPARRSAAPHRHPTAMGAAPSRAASRRISRSSPTSSTRRDRATGREARSQAWPARPPHSVHGPWKSGAGRHGHSALSHVPLSPAAGKETPTSGKSGPALTNRSSGRRGGGRPGALAQKLAANLRARALSAVVQELRAAGFIS
jgi:hypothetical protein